MLLNAKVVGGLQLVDHGEADNKIISVLENDHFRVRGGRYCRFAAASY
jgi:inorganic pyrophosphatase